MFEEGIGSRAVGQYPISIATSLALESANGIHPEIAVKRPPILDYQELWVNLRTLHRNMIGSLDKMTAGLIDGQESAEVLSEEMERVTEIIRDVNAQAQVKFYVCNYERMEQTYPHATIRRDNTDKQKVFTSVMMDCLRYLLDRHRGESYLSVFKRKLEVHVSPPPKVMLMTHIPYDLTAHKRFKELVLLESHTGAIKPRAMWYTKYAQGKELVMIPFREDLLQIFGDNETFHPMDHRLRKEIVELANKYNWSQITTLDRIRLTLEHLPNSFHRDVIKEILKAE